VVGKSYCFCLMKAASVLGAESSSRGAWLIAGPSSYMFPVQLRLQSSIYIYLARLYKGHQHRHQLIYWKLFTDFLAIFNSLSNLHPCIQSMTSWAMVLFLLKLCMCMSWSNNKLKLLVPQLVLSSLRLFEMIFVHAFTHVLFFVLIYTR
jgi:hypothetical protein